MGNNKSNGESTPKTEGSTFVRTRHQQRNVERSREWEWTLVVEDPYAKRSATGGTRLSSSTSDAASSAFYLLYLNWTQNILLWYKCIRMNVHNYRFENAFRNVYSEIDAYMLSESISCQTYLYVSVAWYNCKSNFYAWNMHTCYTNIETWFRPFNIISNSTFGFQPRNVSSFFKPNCRRVQTYTSCL